jgi:tetratricopeptide (TPR) repeat protein
LEIDPGNVDIWDSKGLACSIVEQYEKTIKCYNKIIEIEPNNVHAWNMKALAYRALGDEEKAEYCKEMTKKLL